MASPEELDRLAKEEAASYCPLDRAGINVVHTAQAITRGELIPTVNENGQSRLEERAGRLLPWVLAAGYLAVKAHAAYVSQR